MCSPEVSVPWWAPVRSPRCRHRIRPPSAALPPQPSPRSRLMRPRCLRPRRYEPARPPSPEARAICRRPLLANQDLRPHRTPIPLQRAQNPAAIAQPAEPRRSATAEDGSDVVAHRRRGQQHSRRGRKLFRFVGHDGTPGSGPIIGRYQLEPRAAELGRGVEISWHSVNALSTKAEVENRAGLLNPRFSSGVTNRDDDRSGSEDGCDGALFGCSIETTGYW
jgi:hypothetical protein